MGAERMATNPPTGNREGRIGADRSGVLVRRTQGFCVRCRKAVPAGLFERDGDIQLELHCPVHGPSETLYWTDADLFHQLTGIVGGDAWCRTLECVQGVPCRRCLPKTYNLMMDVTSRCNLSCPVCCTDAVGSDTPDPSIQELVSRLPPAASGPLNRLQRPNVVLFGGEPTLREDLPELVAAIVSQGYIPRLATNGIRSDEDFLRRLRQKGLKWIVFQFDGFTDEVSSRLRGRTLVSQKLEAIERMIALGFKVQLGTMLVEGVNVSEIGNIVRFVGAHPRVFWFSFYPHAAQGRMQVSSNGTSMAETLQSIESATDGRVLVSDFVRTSRWLGRMYRLLRIPGLRPKLSTLPMILVFEGADYYPLVRLLDPAFAARHAVRAGQLIGSLPRLFLYQEEYTPPFVKFMVVEKFHSANAIDLEDASNCHMAFASEQGYIPFDIHNVVTRSSPGSGDPGVCR